MNRASQFDSVMGDFNRPFPREIEEMEIASHQIQQFKVSETKDTHYFKEI